MQGRLLEVVERVVDDLAHEGVAEGELARAAWPQQAARHEGVQRGRDVGPLRRDPREALRRQRLPEHGRRLEQRARRRREPRHAIGDETAHRAEERERRRVGQGRLAERAEDSTAK